MNRQFNTPYLVFSTLALVAALPVLAESRFLPETGPYSPNSNFEALAEAFPKPPVADSIEDRQDKMTVLALQNDSRHAVWCQQAASQVRVTLSNLFGGPTGPLTDSEITRLDSFLKTVAEEGDLAVNHLKRVYKRPRPFVTDSRIDPCIKREKSLSYPSGHATLSRLLALTLSELYPERANHFLASADFTAFLRVAGGVHHPTDIAAGKELGDALYKVMRESDAFRAELQRLKFIEPSQ